MQVNTAEIQIDVNQESFNPEDIEMECVNEMDKGGQLHQKPTPILKSKALKWHMPIIGEVPLSK
jgi:hypothetical protein